MTIDLAAFATTATPLWLAAALGIAAAGATLIGWLLAALRSTWPPLVHGVALAAAAVAMVALTVTELLPEAFSAGLPAGPVLAAIALGVALTLGLIRLGHHLSSGRSTTMAGTAVIVAVAISIHNIPEGAIPVGMATISLGAALSSALLIAFHNIPEGLAVATPVIAAGGSRRRALAFVLMATAGEVIGVLMASRFVTAMTGDGVSYLLASVGGVMLTVSVVELLPSAVGIIRQAVRRAPVMAPSA